MHASAQLLHPDNVWGFVVVVGLIVAISLGLLLAGLGNFIERLTDRLLKREPASDAFDWLRVHEPKASELAAEKQAEFKLFNTLAGTLLVSLIISMVASFSPFFWAFFALSSALLAWRGIAAKTRFRRIAERLREAAINPSSTVVVDTPGSSSSD